jgi:hypothetical protein
MPAGPMVASPTCTWHWGLQGDTRESGDPGQQNTGVGTASVGRFIDQLLLINAMPWIACLQGRHPQDCDH